MYGASFSSAVEVSLCSKKNIFFRADTGNVLTFHGSC